MAACPKINPEWLTMWPAESDSVRSGCGSGKSANAPSQREMGPALRLTPLSPACGPCRSRKLYARRFNAVSVPLRRDAPKSAYHRPALAPAPVPSGAEPGREDLSLPPGGSETGPSARTSNGSTSPVGFAKPRRSPESPACPTLRPRGFSGSGSGPLRENPALASSRSSTARHLAVASIRFQNPLFDAGLSAFVSKGPIPVSMSGRCATETIRARTRACTYPLSATMPVDKGG